MTYDTNKPLLVALYAAAEIERDELIRFNLNLIAGELSNAVDAFSITPTGDNLATVNGHWAHGVRMLGFAGKPRLSEPTPERA